MTIKILFSANDENWKRYEAPLQDACLLYTSPSPRDA